MCKENTPIDSVEDDEVKYRIHTYETDYIPFLDMVDITCIPDSRREYYLAKGLRHMRDRCRDSYDAGNEIMGLIRGMSDLVPDYYALLNTLIPSLMVESNFVEEDEEDEE